MSQQNPYPPGPPQGGYYGYQQAPQGQSYPQQPPQGQPPQQGQYQPQQGQYQPQQGQYQPPQGQYQPPQGQYQPQQGQYQPQQGQHHPPGQYPPPGQAPPGQYAPPSQGPPQGYPGQNAPNQQWPQGAPPSQGQYPPRQQGQYPPQQGQYPPHQGQYPPPQGQYPPQQGQYPPHQGQYPPQQNQYPPQQPYPGQAPPTGQYPPGPHGTPQWQPAPVQPVPASPGYDQAQKQWVQPIDTSADAESLRKAMKGMGCDERALIKTLTQPKFASPWAVQQLVQDYNKRFIRDLNKDIKSETRGTFEDGLLAILRGPLANDVYVLDKAMDRAGTDEVAVADVLLCRTNADIRAIAAEYRRVKNRELLTDIRSEFNDTLHRLYSMVLAATRAEPAAPVIPAEIDHKVTELNRATEGMMGSNALSVAQVLTSSNEAQIRAISETYQRKYHRSLEDVVEKEFRGDVEDALLRMLYAGRDKSKADIDWLRQPMARRMGVKESWLIYRATTLYWDRPRLEAAKQAYMRQHGKPVSREVKEALSSDFEDLILALLGEKKL